MYAASGPESGSKRSSRAGRPLSRTSALTVPLPSGIGEPVGRSLYGAPVPATIVAITSDCSCRITVISEPVSRRASSATAVKTSAGPGSRATSVATRRSAACESASRLSASRPSALATALPISSAKSVSRGSVFEGSPALHEQAATMPHTRPSTEIGAPTEERAPRRRSSGAIESIASS